MSHAVSIVGPGLRSTVALALVASPLLAGSPKPVIKASEALSARSFERRLAALQATHPGLSPEAARQRALRLERAWQLAQASGLLAGAEWRESQQEGRRAILAKAYVDAQPGHPGGTEQQLYAAYMAQGEQRRVSHVLCSTKEQAEAALHRLQGGEPFDRVALDLSRDPSAAVNRGDLGWIRKKDMVAAFGEPVFAAPVGTLLGPLKSEFGWHVAKVIESRSPTVEAFAAERPALLKQAAAAESARKREAALGPLRKRHPLTPDLSVLSVDRTTEPLPGDEARIAGRVAGVTITLKSLKVHLAEVLQTMGQSHSLGADTKARFMEGLADQIRLAAAAQKLGFDRQPKVAAALWLDERERAYARHAGGYLAALNVPEEDLRQHHQLHQERFRAVGALRLQVLVADAKDRVDDALDQIRVGLPWREAVARYGNAEATGDPEPGWVEVDSLRSLVPPTLMQPLLQGQLGQVVGPMLGPDGYMLFKVLERRPGPVLTYEACLDAIRADYLREQGQTLVDQDLDRRLAAR